MNFEEEVPCVSSPTMTSKEEVPCASSSDGDTLPETSTQGFPPSDAAPLATVNNHAQTLPPLEPPPSECLLRVP